MKVRLLYRDRDIDLNRPLPWNEETLTDDLGLDTLFTAMAQGDEFVFGLSKKVILMGFENDPETIRYRQEVLQDCLDEPAIVREIYALAVEAINEEKRHYLSGNLMRHPDWVLRYAIELLEKFLWIMKKLKKVADSQVDKFVSEGWTTLFATLRRELSDQHSADLDQSLEQLKFRNGVLLSAGLGQGNKGTRYMLHMLRHPQRRGWEWLIWLVKSWLGLSEGPSPALGFSLHPRDESGARALAELRNRGISVAANSLAQSADHVRSFFSMLRTELAFYVGCVNLHDQLVGKGEPMCFPLPMVAEERRLSFSGLYDVCLALSQKQGVVGNDANADQQDLVIVTGANQGGKSTFLRSIGLAQLMMQCGLFVPAATFSSSIRDAVLTHYKREEDTSMKSGKLDEELSRMSDIVDHVTSRSMILFNESFAATNEREGSEIGRQIISALLDKQVKIVCVTHLYELARGFYKRNTGNILFLRAERQVNGARTFKLVEGEPLQTSFGEDLYNRIFGIVTDHSRRNDPKAGLGAG